jgi:hypothetical protein
LLVAKESENIRPGNAELQETGWKALICKCIVPGASPRW